MPDSASRYGNKRTAFACLDVFLRKNRYKLKINNQVNEDFTLLVAQGKMNLLDIAKWLEDYTEPY